MAAALGLEHEFVPFNDAIPKGGLLRAALNMSSEQPAPMLNAWMPAYSELVRRAKQRGVRTILSGAGGDEWLSVTPTIAADMMRRGEWGQLRRLVAGWHHSYNLSMPSTLYLLLWKYGLSPVLGGLADRAAPRRLSPQPSPPVDGEPRDRGARRSRSCALKSRHGSSGGCQPSIRRTACTSATPSTWWNTL